MQVCVCWGLKWIKGEKMYLPGISHLTPHPMSCALRLSRPWLRTHNPKWKLVPWGQNPKSAVTYDVIKWRHFPRYWPFVRGIHRSPVNSPHKAQWRGTLMFSLICAWINGWINNRETGDLRRRCAHHDVTAMRHATLKRCWSSHWPKPDIPSPVAVAQNQTSPMKTLHGVSFVTFTILYILCIESVKTLSM